MYDTEYLRIRLNSIERELQTIRLQLERAPVPIPFPGEGFEPRSGYQCSFCGKSQSEVASLIAGPGKVFICSECVTLCHQIEQERLMKLQGKGMEKP